MSSEFHRPTLTYPTGTYNATQVRLYGIAPKSPDSGLMYPGRTVEFTSGLGDIEVNVSVSTHKDDKDGAVPESLKKTITTLSGLGLNDARIFKGLVDNSLPNLAVEKLNCLPDNAPEFLRNLTEASLRKSTAELLNNFVSKAAYVSKISIQMKHLGSVSISASITSKQAITSNKIISCGIIVGYSYEGQTFDLPKPKIMVIPTLPEPSIPRDDSGFDKKEPEGYAVWLVDKLDECVEFELNQGFVEQLILDANLPGKRAPNTYAGRMMMGHRAGRLTE